MFALAQVPECYRRMAPGFYSRAVNHFHVAPNGSANTTTAIAPNSNTTTSCSAVELVTRNANPIPSQSISGATIQHITQNNGSLPPCQREMSTGSSEAVKVCVDLAHQGVVIAVRHSPR